MYITSGANNDAMASCKTLLLVYSRHWQLRAKGIFEMIVCFTKRSYCEAMFLGCSLTRWNENFFWSVLLFCLMNWLIHFIRIVRFLSVKDFSSVSSSSCVTDEHPKIMNNPIGFFLVLLQVLSVYFSVWTTGYCCVI